MGRLFVAVGVAVLCGAIYASALDLWAWMLWPAAVGTVVSVTQSDDGATTAPTVEFVSESGRKATYHSHLSDSSDWRVGRTVGLRYQPGNPENAVIPGRAASSGALMAVFGCFFVYFGIGQARVGRLATRPDWVGSDWLGQAGKIVGVSEDRRFVPLSKAWRITARSSAAADGSVEWRSDPIPFDPSRYLVRRPNDLVEVRCDPADPARAWMDLRWLADAHKLDTDRF